MGLNGTGFQSVVGGDVFVPRIGLINLRLGFGLRVDTFIEEEGQGVLKGFCVKCLRACQE